MRQFVIRICLAWTLFLCCAASGAGAPSTVAVTIDAPNMDTLRRIHVPPPKSEELDGDKRLPPHLPLGAAAKKLAGQVELRVVVEKSGAVQKVTVVQSSGQKLLDETARTWVQYIWRYPATGKAETHHEKISFETTQKAADNEAASVASGRSVFPDTPRPPYPHIAMLQGWQGAVRLRLVPDGQGKVREAQVLSSSGVPLLDLIAKAWCESYWKLPSNTENIGLLTFRLH